MEGKITKRPFTTIGYKVKECLELVYIDMCGLLNVDAWWGYEYFITFTNDYSIYLPNA